MWACWSLKSGMILSRGLFDEFGINLMERLARTGLSFIVFAISFRTGMRSVSLYSCSSWDSSGLGLR